MAPPPSGCPIAADVQQREDGGETQGGQACTAVLISEPFWARERVQQVGDQPQAHDPADDVFWPRSTANPRPVFPRRSGEAP